MSILLVGSRGTIAGFALAFISIKYINNSKRLIFLTAILLSSFIFIYIDPYLFNAVFKIAHENAYIQRMLINTTLTARVLHWGNVINENIFIGKGLGAYTSAARFANLGTGSDSQFISFLSQGGILLLIAYIFIIYSIFKINFLNNIKNNIYSREIKIIIFILLLIVFDSVFNPSLDSRATSIIFWYYLGVLHVYAINFIKNKGMLYNKEALNENTACT